MWPKPNFMWHVLNPFAGASLWGPLKELWEAVEGAIWRRQPESVHLLDLQLKKHKPYFLSLFKNPVGFKTLSIYIITTCVETCNCTFEFGGKLWINCEMENPVLLSLIWFESFKRHSSFCCEYHPSIIKVVHVTYMLVFFNWKSSFFSICFIFYKTALNDLSTNLFFFPAEECGTKREGSESQHRRHCYSGPAGSTTTSWAAHLRNLHP